jgi:hypothetical protein
MIAESRLIFLLNSGVSKEIFEERTQPTENKDMAERGGLKPQPFSNPRFTREIAAIAFTTASFQNLRMKRCEVLRSGKKPKK